MKAYILFTFLCCAINFSIAGNALYPGLFKLNLGSHKFMYEVDSNSNQTISTYKILGITVTVNSAAAYDNPLNWKSDTSYYTFYAHLNDTIPVHHLSFYIEQGVDVYRETSVEHEIESWLKPEIFSGDSIRGYGAIFFLCKSKIGDWMEVVVNTETGETLWIKDGKKSEFISWHNLFKKNHREGVLQAYDIPFVIYSSPHISTDTIIFNEWDCFSVDKIKGDWVKITNSRTEPCREEDRHLIIEKGWIRFRDENGLLVEVFTMY